MGDTQPTTGNTDPKGMKGTLLRQPGVPVVQVPQFLPGVGHLPTCPHPVAVVGLLADGLHAQNALGAPTAPMADKRPVFPTADDGRMEPPNNAPAATGM